MRYWIVKDEADKTKIAIIGSLTRPKGALSPAPMQSERHPEEIEWLKKVKGEYVVDDAAKNLELHRRDEARVLMESGEKVTKGSKKADAIERLRAVDVSKIVRMDQIQTCLNDIMIVLGHKDG